VNDSYTCDNYGDMSWLLAGGGEAALQLRWDNLHMAQMQTFVHLAHSGVARGDDSRVVCICDIGKPRKVPCLSGVVDAYVLPVAMFGTKTHQVRGQAGGTGGMASNFWCFASLSYCS
jgi:hypothetical protein